MSLIEVESTYFFSSDPLLGASNVRNNGSYFQIHLDKPIYVPPTSLDCTIECRTANIWFTCPNIAEEYKNNHFYFSAVSNYDGTITFSSLDTTIDVYDTRRNIGFTATMPVGTFTIIEAMMTAQRVIMFENGSRRTIMNSQVDVQYDPTSKSILWNVSDPYVTIGNNRVLGLGSHNAGAFTSTPVKLQLFDIPIPSGLYNVQELNKALQRGIGLISHDGVRFSTRSIQISGNQATQRVILILSTGITYEQSTTLPNNISGILGYIDQDRVISHQLDNDYFEADGVAQLTRINAFYIHADMVLEGLTINNGYDSVLAEVQISEPPGSLITYRPYNPFRLNGNHLKYGSRQLLTFYLTDERNRPVDTNGEAFSFSIVVKYKVDPKLTGLRGTLPTQGSYA